MLNFVRNFIRRINAVNDYDRRWVPNPNWACKRNGVHYW
jgi:hypothetical protein